MAGSALSAAGPASAQAPDGAATPAALAEAAAPAGLDDEADLAGQLQLLEEDESALHIYGFADFTYTHFLMDRQSRWFDSYFSAYPTFAIGNINLYLEKRIARRWNSLIEFRLLYLPNGTEQVSTTGQVDQIDTSVLDYQDRTEYLRWGGISIERVWVEYQAHRLVTVRAGHWFTPYGIWNADHGSPVLVSTRRPFVIGFSLFPKSQTGIQLYGTRPLGDKSVTYHLTLSNGRGPVDTYLDLDYNKGVGGRLVLETGWLDDFKLGASAYTGTYSARNRSYGARNNQVETDEVLTERYRELCLAADLNLRAGPLLLNAELITRQAVYHDAARPQDMVVIGTQQPDYFAWGGYVLSSYRLPWFGLMPYGAAEYLHTQWGSLPAIVTGTLGLNIRATPTVTIKTQYQRGWVPGSSNPIIPDDEPVSVWESQLAWVF